MKRVTSSLSRSAALFSVFFAPAQIFGGALTHRGQEIDCESVSFEDLADSMLDVRITRQVMSFGG